MKRVLCVLTVIGLLLTVVPMALADTPAVQKIDLSGATLSATSADAAFPATNAIDGDQGSFWNSSKTGSNPCSHKLTVFLDAVYMVDHFVFKLPGHWGDRNEDAVISVSTNGLTFTPVKETTLSFHSANSNVVTVTLDEPVKASSLQLEITSNTDSGENGRAQLGEWEIYGYADPDSAGMPVIGKMALTVDQFFSSGSGDPLERLIDGKFYNANDQWRPNNMPGWLAVSFKGLCEVSAVVIQLPTSWGDRVQTIEVLGSTDGAEYTTLIEAQDYTFGKDEKSTLILTMPQGTRVQFLKILVTKNTGDGCPQFAELEVYGAMIPGSAAIEKIPLDSTMVTVSGTSFGDADYAVDQNNNGNFWQGQGQSATFTLDLQSAYMIKTFTLQIPTSTNPSSWETRTQTLVVQGSMDGETFTDLTQSLDLVFEWGVGRALVRFDDPVKARHLRLAFSNNTGSSGPQIGEIEVFGYPAPAEMTVTFVGKYNETIAVKSATSAAELANILTNTTATALGGYAFTGWSESPADAEQLFDAGGDITVTAVYEQEPAAKGYHLTVGAGVTAKDGLNNAVDGTTALSFDQRITVTAEGDVAYWVLDGAKVGFGKSRYAFYVSGDNDIAAVLTADAEPIAPAVVLQQATYAQGSETFTLTVIAQTSIPAGNSVSEYGVIFTSKVPTTAFLSDPASAVVKVKSSKTGANQQYMAHLLNVKTDRTRYARAYAIVDGVTVYSATAVQFKTAASGVTTDVRAAA